MYVCVCVKGSSFGTTMSCNHWCSFSAGLTALCSTHSAYHHFPQHPRPLPPHYSSFLDYLLDRFVLSDPPWRYPGISAANQIKFFSFAHLSKLKESKITEWSYTCGEIPQMNLVVELNRRRLSRHKLMSPC